MVTSPSGETSILSMPFGPKLVRRMLVTVRAAMMFAFCASRPFSRDLLSWSRMMMYGRPYSSKTSDMAAAARGQQRRQRVGSQPTRLTGCALARDT
jgi:hypothetical protein